VADRRSYIVKEGRTRPGEPKEFIDKAVDYAGSDCLIWPYALTSHGYGNIRYPGIPGTAARVVCTLAHGTAPHDKPHVAHWCGNRPCIAPTHLRWATPSDNRIDRLRHGTESRGTLRSNSKLTETDVLAIREQHWRTGRALAVEFGVAETTISAVRRGVKWRWLTNGAPA
jgi:hypothetical protein